jgi:chorismate mutase
LNLIRKRTNLVKAVIKLKKFKNQIVDRKRINEILRNIKKKSIKNKIDPKITKRVWRSMIYSYIDFERRYFKKK